MTEVLFDTPILHNVMVAPGRKIDLLGLQDEEIQIVQDDTICKNIFFHFGNFFHV